MTARPSLASIAKAVAAPRVKRVRDGNAEARIQASIVEWIRTVAPDCIVAAIPNGGLRSKSEAARMKRTGTLAGMPDLAILAPVGRAFFIECKSKIGRLEIVQETVIYRLSSLGFETAICRSIDDAKAAFHVWKIKTRESAS